MQNQMAHGKSDIAHGKTNTGNTGLAAKPIAHGKTRKGSSLTMTNCPCEQDMTAFFSNFISFDYDVLVKLGKWSCVST